jgi:hypothetical protein
MMQRLSIIPLAGLLALTNLTAAFAEWMEVVTINRSTGQKTVMMTNAGLNSSRQFGRKASAKLVLQCMQYSETPIITPHATIFFASALLRKA